MTTRLKYLLGDFREYYKGWTIVIYTQDGEEYVRFTLSRNPVKYETEAPWNEINAEDWEVEASISEPKVLIYTNIVLEG